MKYDMVMSLGSEAFNDATDAFDKTLDNVFKKMMTRDAEKAKVTLDVDITLIDAETFDALTGEIMKVKSPVIDFNVKQKIEYKKATETKGTIQAKDSMLIYEDGKWIVREVNGHQMTLSDLENGKGK